MRLRNTRVRTKVAALLVSLTALWVFAAWVTIREGVNMLSVNAADQKVSKPLSALVIELQQERRLSLTRPNGAAVGRASELATQRQETDRALSKFRELSTSSGIGIPLSAEVKSKVATLLTELDKLEGARQDVDRGPGGRNSTVLAFDSVIDIAFLLWGDLGQLDDKAISRDARNIVEMLAARELLSREDALATSILTSGRLNSADHLEFVRMVGAQRQKHQEAAADLPPADLKRYRELAASPAALNLRILEDRISRGRPNSKVQVTHAEWRSVTDELLAKENELLEKAGEDVVVRSTPVAVGVVVRLALAGGLGFLAVLASVVLAITTARHLVRQLERLQEAAHELSDVRLPNVVERLGHGEQVDIKAEAPPLEFGDDDIGKVGQAFNAVQETAIRTAVEQAELRRGIRDILLSLARRSQALVHRQLNLLDQMERREIDTEELEDLFRLDHLATRMRRNAENLIILSGATPARGWRRPVPMVDVVRSAVAEVEDYTRVTVMPIDEVHLVGRAVADIAHLLAELIENAVSFSPPYTYAQISGHMVASGYALEIEDRGLGMSDDNLESINRKIADPPEFNLSSSVQLGLYVVGKLAERYGVQVTLKRSPYKGTTAVVIIPRELLEEGESGAPSKSLTVVGATMPEVTDPMESGGRERFTPVLVPSPFEEPLAAPIPDSDAPLPVRQTRNQEQDQGEVTSSGLPVRVPQASLAPSLRDETSGGEPPAEDDPGRSPEEIRRIVGAFQSGTLRGRAASVESETE